MSLLKMSRSDDHAGAAAAELPGRAVRGLLGGEVHFAYPRACLELRHRRLPPPHVRQEYERAGMGYAMEDGAWVRRFSEPSLRLFYLSDVLVHEVGHHVDRFRLHRTPDRAAESFAEQFVRRYGPGVRQLLGQQTPLLIRPAAASRNR